MRRHLAPVLALGVFCASPLRAANLRITVYHTNDIHGWITARPAWFYPADPHRLIGGAAALASVYRKDRGPKLLLDAGDWFQGTPEGDASGGQALAEVINALPYDAVELGNHEFDFGKARVQELAGEIKVPVLAANVYESKGPRPAYLKPWTVKEVAGVKIGIFGLLTTNMPNLTFPENIAGLSFRREVDEAKDDVAALRKAGATVIIAVSHLGFESPKSASFEGDQTLASEVDGIDLIVGGHSHTALKEAVRDATHQTLIAQAGSGLTEVGRVTLEIDPKTKRVVSSSGTLVELWLDRTGEDPQLRRVVGKYVEEARRVYDVVVATAAAFLGRDGAGESALGDWMTDCERQWSGTDLAFQNSGGIRSDMPAGPVTLRTLFDIMPFGNRVVKLRMSGRLVAQVLEHGADRGKGMIQVSGASFAYDAGKPAGQRVSDILVGGKPLDPEASYTVATIDFLVSGGDGYTPFGLAQGKEETRVLLRDVMRSCAEKRPLIQPPPAGRMRARED